MVVQLVCKYLIISNKQQYEICLEYVTIESH